MRTSVSNPPIKKYKSKIPSTKIVLRKECREKIFTNTFDSGTFEETILKKILQKVGRWWAWENELIACYITVRIPPNSLISPGCCILQVCAPAGVYKRVGPRISHFLLYSIVDKYTYVIGDWNNACILVRNSFYKKVLRGLPLLSLCAQLDNLPRYL